MSVNEVNAAVAKATGEDLRTIAWLGFVLSFGALKGATHWRFKCPQCLVV